MPEIYAPPGIEPVWPASIETLEQFYQQTVFPSFMTTEEKAEFWLFSVDVLPQPKHNPRLEVCSQRLPELTDDHWVVRWDKRDATPEEIAAWDAAHPPEPNWTTWAESLLSPEVREYSRQIYVSAPDLGAALSAGVANCSADQGAAFLRIWRVALRAMPSLEPVVPIIQQSATQNSLPAAFIASLAPTAPVDDRRQGKLQ